MDIEQSNVNALMKLGLSEYEARIYIALVKSGPSRAGELSFLSNVPRTKSYGALKELIRKGLVLSIPEKPEKYLAASPNETLFPLVERLNHDLRRAEETIQSLALSYESMKYVRKVEPYEKSEIWVLKGRSEIYNKINEMFNNAERSIHVTTTSNGIVRSYKSNARALEKCKSKGVKIRFIAPISKQNAKVATEFMEITEIHYLQMQPEIQSVCTDCKSVLFTEAIPDDQDATEGRDGGVWTTSPFLTRASDWSFNYLWDHLPPARTVLKDL
jgi:sugar-specific transcriptional regulator TrmB